jgi:DNA-binding beta-propeller fold protein YncE
MCASSLFAEDKSAPDQQAPKAVRRLPGVQPHGEILLPTQWSLQPAGKQLVLGDFPVNIALHPKLNFAAILHAGYGEHGIHIVDLAKGKLVSQVALPQVFYGVCFDPAGEHVYASGAESELIYQFDFTDGYLSKPRQLKIGDPKETLVPSGLSCSADGQTLFVALGWGHALSILPIAKPDAAVRIPFARDSYPYTTLPAKSGKHVYVSLWGGSAVAVVNVETQQIDATWKVDSHPTEMVLSPDGKTLYVACANSNHVVLLDTESGRQLEMISSALYPKAPSGSTPNSLSLSLDGQLLVVANADNNNLALFNVSERAASKSLGFIPVGWYPTSVRFGQDGQLHVANGKGLLPKANRQGNKTVQDEVAKPLREYIGGLFRGTLGTLKVPTPQEMSAFTKQAYECSPLQADQGAKNATRSADNPIPAKVGDASPIKHCIYIIKENRTYDQVFGDLRQGNGDPDICIFPARVTPNHHALVEEFVLLDNFYVESEVSADGHEWSMAAYATDFVEKTWPLNYRGDKGKLAYPSEGEFPIAFPAGGYIWDRCRQAGVSYRSYGEFIHNPKVLGEPATTKVKSLDGHFDPFYRSYDLDYSDQLRADRFIAELQRFEKEGNFPQFTVMRLPNDHTYGARVGKPTPTAMVADNDLALGRVVEAISHSKFWNNTVIFIVEDDAQNGSDHVDAHRTVALVISPYTQRKVVDSNMYSTSSMLRTMELILGLKPMSQFDAAALPMYASFQGKPDFTPYQHRPITVDLNQKNEKLAWGAERSEKMNLAVEDAADDILFNEIIWKSVKGPESRMPPPVRASFVLAHPKEEEEDEEDDDD